MFCNSQFFSPFRNKVIHNTLEGKSTNETKIKKRIFMVLVASIGYSVFIVTLNGVADNEFLPAVLYCMGIPIPPDYSKTIIYLGFLPMVILIMMTFWFDFRTKRLTSKFKVAPEYNELRKEMNGAHHLV